MICWEGSMVSDPGREPGPRSGKPFQPGECPDISQALQALTPPRPAGAVDVLLVNPPAPDGGIWIRSQHRVGRRSREGMIWPQVSLAQMAALLAPDYSVEIVDAIAERLSWPQFEALLRQKRPRYYVTQATAPTLQNDMYGTFLAHSLGARTITFGTHVTPLTRETMEPYPSLDFVLRGEPELTLVELIEMLEAGNQRINESANQRMDESGNQRINESANWRMGELANGRVGKSVGRWERLFREADPDWQPAWERDDTQPASLITHHSSLITPQAAHGPPFRGVSRIKGLAWRKGNEIVINPDRPFIKNLDDLPLPRHDLLPLDRYRAPMIKGPYSFVVTSRGCPANCQFCIKHVSYGRTVRVRSPENVLAELRLLRDLGLRDVNMYADLFTVDRDQVVGICELMLQEKLDFRWMCNSRVDFVDEEMLRLIARAGCWMIAWGIESANEGILQRVRKGYRPERAVQALGWARAAGIKNWGYFIVGLPGETDETVRQTIELAKKLPLDLVLFHIAAPYPGTPFFFEAVEKGWFRPGTCWEEVDMDRSTVLDYPQMPAERIEYWARRAFREWALRPGPLWTFLKSINNLAVLRSGMEVALQHVGWLSG
jgi:anaerobic magnesium-protoporphyrin IX monomethyl ester cyclase